MTTWGSYIPPITDPLTQLVVPTFDYPFAKTKVEDPPVRTLRKDGRGGRVRGREGGVGREDQGP